MTKHVKPPTAHHYVPVFMSRRFVDANGRLHFYDKRIADRGLLAGRPEDVFKQSHLNSIKRSDGSRNTQPETQFYGPIDDLAAELVERIVSSARLGKTPQFARPEKEAWDFFFYNQWKRAPDVYQRMGLHESFEEDLKRFIAEYEREYGPLTAEQRVDLESDTGKARIKHNASVSARMRPGPDVLGVLAEKGLCILRVIHPAKCFVVASSSVVKLTSPGKTSLADPSVEAWMPIAHDVALSPGGKAGLERLVDIAPHDVRGINEATFLNSLVIAGRSPALVASLVGLKRKKS